MDPKLDSNISLLVFLGAVLRYHACGHPFRNRCPVSGHLLRNPQSNIFIAHCFGCCMCLATHSVTGARFPGTCYGMSQLTLLWGYHRGPLCQPANPCITLLWGYWGYLGAPFANQQILGLQALGLEGLPQGTLCQPANPWITSSRATGATSGHPLPISKSLDYKL